MAKVLSQYDPSQPQPILIGTEGDDTIYGSSRGDIIDALGGDNMLFGGSGDDSVTAADGDNYVDLGSGNDNLTLGLGDNVVLGGSGSDFVAVGQSLIDQYYTLEDGTLVTYQIVDEYAGGNNFVDGGSGNDVIIAYAGDDTLMGGSSNDYLSGGRGVDFLYGGAGDDVLVGGADPDMLNGGAGNDTIYAGADDTVTGGPGHDTIVVTTWQDGFGTIAVTDFGRGDVLDLNQLFYQGITSVDQLSITRDGTLVADNADTGAHVEVTGMNAISLVGIAAAVANGTIVLGTDWGDRG